MGQVIKQNPVQANFAARMNLLASGVKMVKKLQPHSGALGSQIVIPLDRSGILTGVELHVSATLNIAAADTTPNSFGIYSLLKSVTYTDFAAVNRSVIPGAFLNALNSIRLGKLFNDPASSLADAATNLLESPPNVINAAAPLSFIVRVPLAYGPDDTTGAVLSQTATGNHYITVQLASALAGADDILFPYGAGSTATIGDVTIVAFQEYIQPQSLAGLPIIDLSTIYGFEGNYTTSDNLSVGQEKYINYPNMRSVLSAMVAYNNGNVYNPGTDISAVRVIANSNVNIIDATAKYLLLRQRNKLAADLAPGLYFLDTRRNPINTTLYGNVQIGLTPNSVGAASYMAYGFETKYPSGQPLPGIAQG